MKKIILILLAALLCVGTFACSPAPSQETTAVQSTGAQTPTESVPAVKPTPDKPTETPTPDLPTETPTPAPPTEQDSPTTPTPTPVKETPFSVESLQGIWQNAEGAEPAGFVFGEGTRCATVSFGAEGQPENVVLLTYSVFEDTVCVSYLMLPAVAYELKGCIVEKNGEKRMQVTINGAPAELKKVSDDISVLVVDEPTTEPEPDLTITATIKSKSYEVTQTGEGTVSIKGDAKPAANDLVTAKIAGKYLKVKAEGLKTEQILYLPNGEFSYKYTGSSSVYMPSGYTGKPLSFTFTIPTEEELAQRRNLALNPFDFTTKTVGLPHATTSNVYDTSGQFIARNAIDGYTSNQGHGNYPYESWGPLAVVKKTDHFTIDFGREVSLDEVVLYLRADGFSGSHAHDAYFSEIVLEFSNGTSVTIHPTRTAKAQSFTFDPVLTTSLKLTGFVTDKSNSDGWAAITEIEAYGADVLQ